MPKQQVSRKSVNWHARHGHVRPNKTTGCGSLFLVAVGPEKKARATDHAHRAPVIEGGRARLARLAMAKHSCGCL